MLASDPLSNIQRTVKHCKLNVSSLSTKDILCVPAQVKRDLERLQNLQTSDPSSPQLGPLLQIESTCLQLLNEHLTKLSNANSPWWSDTKFVKLGKSYFQHLLGIVLNALRHYKALYKNFGNKMDPSLVQPMDVIYKLTHALLTPLLDWLFSEPLLSLSHDPNVIKSALDICSFACEENDFLIINLVWKNLLRFTTALSSQKLIVGECMTLIQRSLFVDGFGHLQRSYTVETDANSKRFAVLCDIFSNMSENQTYRKSFNEAKFYLGLLNNIIKLFPHDATSTDADLENICQMIAFSGTLCFTDPMRSIPDSIIVQQGLQCIISCILQTDIAEERRLAFVRALSKVTLEKFTGTGKPDKAATFRGMKMYWIACVLKNFECFSSAGQVQLLGFEHSVKLLDELIESFDLTTSLMLSYSLTSDRSLKENIWIIFGVFLHTIDSAVWGLVQNRLLSHYLSVRQDATGALLLDVFELIALKAPPELFSDLFASTLFILERLPVLCTPSIRLAKLIDRIQMTYESRNLQVPVFGASWLDYHSLEFIDNAQLKRAMEMWSLPVTLTQDPSLLTRHTETCFQLWRHLCSQLELQTDQIKVVQYFQLLRSPAQCLVSLALYLQTRPIAPVKHIFNTQLSEITLAFPVLLEGGMQSLQCPAASSKEMMDQTSKTCGALVSLICHVIPWIPSEVMDPIVSALVKWTQSPIKSLLPFVQASNLAVKAYADSRYSNSKALSKNLVKLLNFIVSQKNPQSLSILSNLPFSDKFYKESQSVLVKFRESPQSFAPLHSNLSTSTLILHRLKPASFTSDTPPQTPTESSKVYTSLNHLTEFMDNPSNNLTVQELQDQLRQLQQCLVTFSASESVIR